MLIIYSKIFYKCISNVHQSVVVHRLFRFHSPLLPESRLISFPIGTVMFYFPTFYNFRFSLGLYYYHIYM